jgi:RimJ/RimL family protein N-acetyltransferase
LKLNKLTTEAFDLRPYLIETLEKNGFVLEGRLRSHNLINGIYRDSLLHACFNSFLSE